MTFKVDVCIVICDFVISGFRDQVFISILSRLKPQDAIQAVFQAVVVNKLTYATPAWYGFTNAADRGRLDSFLRRSAKLGYRDANSLSFDNMCETADERLFSRIVNNSLHPLYSLLPPKRDQHYELRERAHNFQLPPRSSSLTDSNFLTRMLFKNTGCAP